MGARVRDKHQEVDLKKNGVRGDIPNRSAVTLWLLTTTTGWPAIFSEKMGPNRLRQSKHERAARRLFKSRSPYCCFHSVNLNQGILLGTSKTFPMIGSPGGPGGIFRLRSEVDTTDLTSHTSTTAAKATYTRGPLERGTASASSLSFASCVNSRLILSSTRDRGRYWVSVRPREGELVFVQADE